MSNIIISAKNLSKTYRLYTKPYYRILDIISQLRGEGKYTEHHALYKINLEIKRGEKVALIGRNGAGKSTLLKLITGVIQPTSGSLVVNSDASALLQIGTTFYPEFTGRENVLSYLAHLGVTGEDAALKLLEIIEFSELEEYIDQPVKTYSTGMGARLMFAASTVMQLDLLVIDEILSVGDSYFAKKSFERIENVCKNGDTTLILVSHDIYNAQKLCDRMIWIDQGRILLDDIPEVVLRGYEDSIRLQEEARLKKKVLMALRNNQDSSTSVYLEIRTQDGRPLKAPVFFSEITLIHKNSELRTINWDSPTLNDTVQVITEGSAWGRAEVHSGRRGRWMVNHGIFHKIAVHFKLAHFQLSKVIGNKELTVKVEAWCDQDSTLVGVLDIEGRQFFLSLLNISALAWNSEIISLADVDNDMSDLSALNSVNTTGLQGTGALMIEDISLLDLSGNKTFKINHGEPASFTLDYNVVDRELNECCDICLVIFRAGTRETICRFLTRDLHIDGNSPKGTIKLKIERVILGSGKFSLWVFVAKNGYLARDQQLFYSINPDVYLSLPNILEFEVAGDLFTINTAFVDVGAWSLEKTSTLNENSNNDGIHQLPHE